MVVSVIIIILWLGLGIVGIACDKNDNMITNFPMILFIVFVPFFPFIFHWCGLF